MREIMQQLPEKKRELMRDILSRYLDHNPATRKTDIQLKKYATERIEHFVKSSAEQKAQK